jgi:DNA-binding HxlR family transcriptional regulator
LTPLGRELLDQFLPLNAFAERWAAETLAEQG